MSLASVTQSRKPLKHRFFAPTGYTDEPPTLSNRTTATEACKLSLRAMKPSALTLPWLELSSIVRLISRSCVSKCLLLMDRDLCFHYG